MKRHGARVHVSEKALMKWLGFTSGKVHYFGRAEEYLDTIIIVVEHPDLPEAKEGELLPDVTPIYVNPPIKRIFPQIHNPLMRLLRKFW